MVDAWQKQAMKDVQAAISFGEPQAGIDRRFPNGETTEVNLRTADESIVGHERTLGSEPSQYQEEKKETSIAIVVASEIATA